MESDTPAPAPRHVVVVNHEEQYSLWLADREIPAGWRAAGVEGTRDECLDWIERNWTDMRPLSVRRALVELMEDEGYQVAEARDGLEALDLINANPPALVLLDLEMPRLNGLEVTRFMRGRDETRNVPVGMITSRTGERYRVEADEAGVTVLLGKPFQEDGLVRTVQGLMQERAAQAERSRNE